MDRRTLGRLGEDAAAAALAARGYVIIRRNVRSRGGEIDLVAVHGRELVFVEVKTRTGTDLGRPFDAVHPGKQRRLVRLARAFMHREGFGNRSCRFDAVGVMVTREGNVVEVDVLPDAIEI
jgi:putative endonuclease